MKKLFIFLLVVPIVSFAASPGWIVQCTAHGDFWNTWEQSKLIELTNNCINAGIDCGKFE